MCLVIKKCSVSQIKGDDNISELLSEYAQELAIDGLPHPSAEMETYEKLESIGALQVIAAYFEGILIGLINVLTVHNPHYSAPLASSESFFVAEKYRHTGAGLKLLREAEGFVKEKGYSGFFVSAPVGGSLEKILPKMEYSAKSSSFFRRFSDA